MMNRSEISVLILMVVFSPLAIDIYLPALPIMSQELSVSVTQMQWSVTLFLLCLGFGQLIGGPLADRYGRRPIALGGLIIYGVTSLLSVFSTSFESLLYCRMIQALGTCGIVVAAFASVRDRCDTLQCSSIYSYLSGVIYCVPALAPLLGNILTEQFGWRSNFIAMAVYAICAGGVIFITFPETIPNKRIHYKNLITIEHFKPIIKHPIFLFNAIVVMFTMATIIAFVTSSPAWIMGNLNNSQQSFVLWFSLNAMLNVVAYFLVPNIVKKLGIEKSTGLGLLILIFSGLLMYALLDWDHVAVYMLPIMVSSIGASFLMGSCAAQALSPFADNAGSASALLGFIQMTGAAVIVFLLQLLPIPSPEQLTWLTLIFLPIFLLWQLPSVKHTLYNTALNCDLLH
jgi:DHA1 family bicyclomycin/chloramphenicol resistance-like MFS transporter